MLFVFLISIIIKYEGYFNSFRDDYESKPRHWSKGAFEGSNFKHFHFPALLDKAL